MPAERWFHAYKDLLNKNARLNTGSVEVALFDGTESLLKTYVRNYRLPSEIGVKN